MSSLIVRAGARQSPSHENEAAPDYVSGMSLQNADDLTDATRGRDPRDPKLASEPPDPRDPDPHDHTLVKCRATTLPAMPSPDGQAARRSR